MIKKLFHILSLLIVIVFSSCSFLLQDSGKNIDIILGEENASRIINSVRTVITEDSEFLISATLDGVQYNPISTTVKYSELGNAHIFLTDIPLNKEVNVVIRIFFDGIRLYSGESEVVTFTEDNDFISLKVEVQPHKSRITYETNGGTFSDESALVKEYFITDDITSDDIPKLSKSDDTFKGWYFDKEFTKPFTNLGMNNYIGDVTLYAKFVNYEKVSNFRVAKGRDNPNTLEITWNNPSMDSLDYVRITCNEDKNINEEIRGQAGESKKITLNKIEYGKENYTFNAICVYKDGGESPAQSSKITLPIITNISTIPAQQANGKMFLVNIQGRNLLGESIITSSPGVVAAIQPQGISSSTSMQLRVYTTNDAQDEGSVTVSFIGESKTQKFDIKDSYNVGDTIYVNGTEPIAVIYKADKRGSALGVSTKQTDNVRWTKSSDRSAFDGLDKGLIMVASPNKYDPNHRYSASASDPYYIYKQGNNVDGQKDGQDNYNVIVAHFGGSTTEVETNAPIFSYTNKYASKVDSRVSNTSFETGWYVPSIYELCILYNENKKGTLNLDIPLDRMYYSSNTICKDEVSGKEYKNASPGYVCFGKALPVTPSDLQDGQIHWDSEEATLRAIHKF